MAPLPANRDRWLALGLLLAALAAGYLLLVHPWWTVPLVQANSRVADLRERDLRIRMQLQQAPEVQRQWELAIAQQAQRPGFLPEATVELATAGLVQRLEAVVREASPGNRSCAISNQSPLNIPGKEQFARVAVQVRIRCGTPETAAVLYALETGSPRLFIENLNILSQRFAYMAQETGAGGLDVSFDLYGYLQPSRSLEGNPEGALPPSAPAGGGGNAR